MGLILKWSEMREKIRVYRIAASALGISTHKKNAYLEILNKVVKDA